ncbi:hypothetical protein AB0B50_44320 [Streptomyces sp. NPDC041068]|uniref:hypothetical protein n=1 Tax=Streptomyces sp. NPDC041068 TaxID=3155130 RepID=UPI0033D01245
MEPVTLVLTALAAGAVAGLKDTAGAAVKDAYMALKGLVSRRIADQPLGEQLVEQYESAADTWREPLRAALLSAGADKDPEVARMAGELLKMTDAEATAASKYTLHVEGNVQGLAQGDHQRVDMTFDRPPADN